MILSENMVDILHAIRNIESAKISKILDVKTSELGNCLIKVYFSTDNLETRELITEFMTEAGAVWLRKLLTRDTAPISSTMRQFASIDDYMGLLAANDESVSANTNIDAV